MKFILLCSGCFFVVNSANACPNFEGSYETSVYKENEKQTYQLFVDVKQTGCSNLSLTLSEPGYPADTQQFQIDGQEHPAAYGFTVVTHWDFNKLESKQVRINTKDSGAVDFIENSVSVYSLNEKGEFAMELKTYTEYTDGRPSKAGPEAKYVAKRIK